jgi:hypothetical protein
MVHITTYYVSSNGQILGIHIWRDRSAGTITVNQEDKTLALAAELGVRQVQGGVRGIVGGTTQGTHG